MPRPTRITELPANFTATDLARVLAACYGGGWIDVVSKSGTYDESAACAHVACASPEHAEAIARALDLSPNLHTLVRGRTVIVDGITRPPGRRSLNAAERHAANALFDLELGGTAVGLGWAWECECGTANLSPSALCRGCQDFDVAHVVAA